MIISNISVTILRNEYDEQYEESNDYCVHNNNSRMGGPVSGVAGYTNLQ